MFSFRSALSPESQTLIPTCVSHKDLKENLVSLSPHPRAVFLPIFPCPISSAQWSTLGALGPGEGDTGCLKMSHLGDLVIQAQSVPLLPRPCPEPSSCCPHGTTTLRITLNDINSVEHRYSAPLSSLSLIFSSRRHTPQH